jgi:hypothetical protein
MSLNKRNKTVDIVCIQNELKQCLDLYKLHFYKRNESKFCKIHDLLKTDEVDHNCLGCNLNESFELIIEFLKNYKHYNNLNYALTQFILIHYLLSERIETILNIISIPEYSKEKFKILNRIKRWSNFIKHPKSFVLVHHAYYNYVDSGFEYTPTVNFDLTIDDQFIDEFYKGHHNKEEQEKQNKKLYDKIKKSNKVLVLFPNFLKLTNDLNVCFLEFLEIIETNKIFKEKLKTEATFKNYFNKSIILNS